MQLLEKAKATAEEKRALAEEKKDTVSREAYQKAASRVELYEKSYKESVEKAELALKKIVSIEEKRAYRAHCLEKLAAHMATGLFVEGAFTNQIFDQLPGFENKGFDIPKIEGNPVKTLYVWGSVLDTIKTEIAVASAEARAATIEYHIAIGLKKSAKSATTGAAETVSSAKKRQARRRVALPAVTPSPGCVQIRSDNVVQESITEAMVDWAQMERHEIHGQGEESINVELFNDKTDEGRAYREECFRSSKNKAGIYLQLIKNLVFKASSDGTFPELTGHASYIGKASNDILLRVTPEIQNSAVRCHPDCFNDLGNAIYQTAEDTVNTTNLQSQLKVFALTHPSLKGNEDACSLLEEIAMDAVTLNEKYIIGSIENPLYSEGGDDIVFSLNKNDNFIFNKLGNRSHWFPGYNWCSTPRVVSTGTERKPLKEIRAEVNADPNKKQEILAKMRLKRNELAGKMVKNGCPVKLNACADIITKDDAGIQTTSGDIIKVEGKAVFLNNKPVLNKP